VLADVEVDELVGNNAHLLQGKGLDTSPGETLDDPALRLLFIAFDLGLHQFNHDIVVNCK